MPASKFSGSSVATSPGRIPNASSFMGYLAEPTVGQPPPVLKTARGHGRWRLPTGGAWPPTCREPFYRIKISLYGLRQYAVRRIFARAAAHWETSHDGFIGPLALRRAPHRPQGGWGGDAPAHPRAPRRGRADRLGSHRNPAPVPAAYFAPPTAPRRSRPGRALPRGQL